MRVDPAVIADLHDGGVRNARPLPRCEADETAAELASTGLCDLQVNGFAGVDYNDPALTPRALERSLTALLGSGVTSCLPTVISAPPDWQRGCLRALEAGREASPLARRMILGYHLEGPFLNPQPGFCGCHPAEAMIAADWDYFQSLQRAAGGRIRLITVAPEVPGVMTLIPRWVEAGVRVAIGHSAAGYRLLRRAVEAGASLSTHLGNATAAALAKNDNPIIAQLALDGLAASFIADGYHLSRQVLQVYLRAKQPQRTLLVSDATAGALAPPGAYTLGRVRLERRRRSEAAVYLPGTDSLAGSAAPLALCVRNVVDWYALPADTALRWAGDRPRELLGLPAAATAGEPADWVWWRRGEHGLQVERVQLGETVVEAGGP